MIVVDFPDPTNFSIGKLYTNAFYALLDQRLAASGYAVVQTTSPLVARQSFWTVAATMESVGLQHRALPRPRAQLRRMGLRHRQPPALARCRRRCPRACASSRWTALPRAVRLPARHGARAGRGEPPVQPGAGDHLRARMGQGAPMIDAARRAGSPGAAAAGRAASRARRHRRRLQRRRRRARPPAARARARLACAGGHAARARCVIAGGGVAGLAAARALRQRGIEDFVLLDLEDAAGGNSRGGEVGGIACPLGAHYLPVPGDDAPRGAGPAGGAGLAPARRRPLALRRAPAVPRAAGAAVLPGRVAGGLAAAGTASAPATLAQYARFAQRGGARARRRRLPHPGVAAPRARHARAGRETFAAWLDARRLRRPATALVPGLLLPRRLRRRHRHGVGLGRPALLRQPPRLPAARRGRAGEREARADLAGGQWLAHARGWPRRWASACAAAGWCCASPSGGTAWRWMPGTSRTQRVERWQAARCIVALPAVRRGAGGARTRRQLLRRAGAQRARYAPWVVANLHLRAPLDDRPGAPPAWDNVIYGDRTGLGYVDGARHQSLDPARPGRRRCCSSLVLRDRSARVRCRTGCRSVTRGGGALRPRCHPVPGAIAGTADAATACACDWAAIRSSRRPSRRPSRGLGRCRGDGGGVGAAVGGSRRTHRAWTAMPMACIGVPLAPDMSCRSRPSGCDGSGSPSEV